MPTTISFLMDCPQCGLTIPKGGPCTDCHWSENAEAAIDSDQDMVRAFAARRQVHLRNYAIFMVLAFATGLIGLFTTIMWFKIMYLGNIVEMAPTDEIIFNPMHPYSKALLRSISALSSVIP